MKHLQSRIPTFVLIMSALFVAPAAAFAQTDEIQVYDAVIAEPGIFNLTWHNNFIADGAKTPAFPGGLIPDKSFNGVTEWAYGVTDWFEAGLYLPLYSISQDRGATINGGKIRLLFVQPMLPITGSSTAQILSSATTLCTGSRATLRRRSGRSSAGTCTPWISL
jgi:hypothetical protein